MSVVTGSEYDHVDFTRQGVTIRHPFKDATSRQAADDALAAVHSLTTIQRTGTFEVTSTSDVTTLSIPIYTFSSSPITVTISGLQFAGTCEFEYVKSPDDGNHESIYNVQTLWRIATEVTDTYSPYFCCSQINVRIQFMEAGTVSYSVTQTVGIDDTGRQLKALDGKKLNANLGSYNAGSILIVDSYGNVLPSESLVLGTGANAVTVTAAQLQQLLNLIT